MKGSDDPDVLLNLALVLQHSHRYGDALVVINHAVKLAPNGMLYRYIRATIYEAIGGSEKLAKALSEYLLRTGSIHGHIYAPQHPLIHCCFRSVYDRCV